MLAKLVAWLGDTRADLSVIAVERDFDVVVGDARLRGRVDRLERDRAGRPVVVDLKTGKSKPTAEELAVHPQLGAYQLAVQHDGFAGVATGEEPGGARLVQLGREVKKYEDQQQPPLGEQDDPLWIARQVAYIAGRYARGAVPRDRELLLRQVRPEDELSADGRRPTGDPMTDLGSPVGGAVRFAGSDPGAGGGDPGAAGAVRRDRRGRVRQDRDDGRAGRLAGRQPAWWRRTRCSG